MTPALATSPAEYFPISRRRSSGTTTQTASKLETFVAVAVEHARQNANDWRTLCRDLVEMIARENSVLGWDGYGALPISVAAKHYAQRFIDGLPFNIPAPEVMPDPDGEVALCWDFGPGKILTLAFGATGMISYAGLLGGGVKRHGMEPFKDTIPKVLLETLNELRSRAGYAG